MLLLAECSWAEGGDPWAEDTGNREAAAQEWQATRAAAVVTPGPAEAVRAEGRWAERGEERAGAGRRWSLEGLRLADDAVRGRIAVTGSEYLDGANVEARLSGRGVVGRLLSDEGRLLAEFEGRLTAAGAAGTYRDRFGGRGEWEVE